MNRARDWREFVTGAKLFAAPQQNIVYADVEGNIGLVAPGRVPVRKAGNDLNGLYPAPGWDALYDWAGAIPFESLPQVYNPAAGAIATANERVVPKDYPHHLTYEWAAPYRARRIAEMLPRTKKHTAESFREIQADVRSLAVLDVLPLLLEVPPIGDRANWAHALLSKWDGVMSADRPEPLIVAAWQRELLRRLIKDELGDSLTNSMFDHRHQFLLATLRGANGQSRWCDDVTTSVVEQCADQISGALTAALDDLVVRFGSDGSKWRWGAAHFAKSEHRPLGAVPALAKYFNVHVETGGDTFTVNPGRNNMRNPLTPFASTHGASLRAIYDLANPEASLFMHSTGQSGIWFSPHYADLAQRWANVSYIAMTTTRSAIKAPIGTLRLVP